MKTSFSVALLAAMASAASPDMKKLTAFNNLVMNSKVGGKVMSSYPEYDFSLEDKLDHGCNAPTGQTNEWGDIFSWTTDL